MEVLTMVALVEEERVLEEVATGKEMIAVE